MFISTNTAVLVLRKAHVGDRHFPVPIVIPCLTLACCLLLLLQQEAATRLRAGILLAIAQVLDFIARWVGAGRRRNAVESSERTAAADPGERSTLRYSGATRSSRVAGPVGPRRLRHR